MKQARVTMEVGNDVFDGLKEKFTEAMRRDDVQAIVLTASLDSIDDHDHCDDLHFLNFDFDCCLSDFNQFWLDFGFDEFRRAGSWRLLAPGSAAESAPHDGGLVSFFRRVFSAPAKLRDPAVCGGSRPDPATLTLSDGCGSELRQLM
ncbi:hypothetical protein CASFOL_030090 [Castilleja foliolosa]|uniref:Uncharacterized protein n=1 Tax=Castilleja foliolosa TaxID=1961234 RepID=A0ABD3C9S7_9LAMI